MVKAHQIVLALALFATYTFGLTQQGTQWLLKKQFEDFKVQYNRHYESAEEEAIRFQYFQASIENIVEMNTPTTKATWGITKFSDWSQAEFESYLKTDPTMNTIPSNIVVKKPRFTSVPSSFDWRDYSVVTPVKDQGYCGSCWAFSATETIESAWVIAGNDMTLFSEQQIVSCDTSDAGCNGGYPSSAFDYVKSAGGMATEASYPYSDSAGTTSDCISFTVSGGQVSSWAYANTPCSSAFCNNQDEDTMQLNLVSYQPLSIVVDASKWSSYVSGVVSSSECSDHYLKLDHAVQLVGYNSDATTPYWIVRNSWNTDWGVDGYIYLEMGTNTCGVADQPTMVTVA